MIHYHVVHVVTFCTLSLANGETSTVIISY